MTELGNTLKAAREANGLSLDDLQQLTKIQKRYLVGIENGEYSMMPGKFYVRAFIKQYAEAVGLDPEELFEQYNNEIPASHNEEIPEQLSRVQSKKTLSPMQSKLLEALPKILVVVFILGAAILIWWVATKLVDGSESNQSSGDNQNDQVKVVENKDASDSKDKGQDEKTTAKDEDQSKPKKDKKKDHSKGTDDDVKQELKSTDFSGKHSSYQLANAKEFKLKLTSKGETWVSVKDSEGKSYYQGMLKEGESEEIDLSSAQGADMIIGNTTATDIYVNGQLLEYAISPTERVNQNISIAFQKAE
ncbi:helix-turn-helix domain-containing protein [Bacillus testis]|uniref:helix-turn-helix domain-containing protein n=1 Tax=Bacillus testis TaxID=1622072 RepID=UPI00067EB496|nr:RodZ family helix-turn-helix domain-containing protein [Bacillus testis]